MSDIPPSASEDIVEELKNLGKSLGDFVDKAWNSQDRQRIQQEIQTSIDDIGDQIKKWTTEFSESEQGRQVKQEFEDLRHRVESGELESKIHNEILNVIRSLNGKVTDASGRWSTGANPSEQNNPQPPANEPTSGNPT